ncbi:hypothetical protein FKM82_022270 [Ascaphus truei]
MPSSTPHGSSFGGIADFYTLAFWLLAPPRGLLALHWHSPPHTGTSQMSLEEFLFEQYTVPYWCYQAHRTHAGNSLSALALRCACSDVTGSAELHCA